jgi:4-hydroxybenzoate polyprenyltransferase
MASALLRAKGDTKDLGMRWIDQFLYRHPALKSKFVSGLEKNRVAAEDPAIVKHWFELVKQQIVDNAVEMEDIFNMDEKGVMMGAAEKTRVIISKHEKKQYMTASGSREWVSFLECISATGKALSPWIIFKGKMHKASWMKALKSGHIALSDNGWTDNELGLAWLKDCFHPETLRYDDSGKQRTRVLIFDGHASHNIRRYTILPRRKDYTSLSPPAFNLPSSASGRRSLFAIRSLL